MLQEIHRILLPDGIAVISSVMKFRIHDYPLDYWRFTPEGFKSLLKPFSSSFVGYAGKPKFPHTVVGIGFKGERPDLRTFEDQYARWQSSQAPPSAVARLWKLIGRFARPLQRRS